MVVAIMQAHVYTVEPLIKDSRHFPMHQPISGSTFLPPRGQSLYNGQNAPSQCVHCFKGSTVLQDHVESGKVHGHRITLMCMMQRAGHG